MDLSNAEPLQDGRFLLLEALGRGGMAAVYRAFDRVEQRLVALKVQREAVRAGPAHPLSTEFEAWSRLRHPNVVRAYGLGLARSGPLATGTPYLVLEHVAGRPLHQALRPGREPPEVVEAVAVQLLRGLSHVHDAGFVHRDLKPANVLVDPAADGGSRIKLTDFGLAVERGAVSEPGRISGSIPYVAPEALIGLPLDGRADLYGLGILLYELATGELPAKHADAESWLRWHLVGAPVDPRRIRPRLTPRLARFVRRLCERDRDRRPRNTREALALLGVRAGRGPRRARTGDAERARLRLALDAARLGALRAERLPAANAETERLLDDVSVWTQVRGIGFHRLGGGRDGVVQLVLRLLLERSGSCAPAVRTFGLDRWMPLALIGGHPVVDRTRPAALAVPLLPACARSVCNFLLRCPARQTLVLHVEPAAREDPLVDALTRRLEERVRDSASPAPGRGGLLLLL